MTTPHRLGVLSLLACFAGCTTLMPLPKSASMSYSTEATGLDFGAIYVAKNQPGPRREWLDDSIEAVYSFYRFWPNGCVLFAYSLEPPTQREAEDLQTGFKGYYDVRGGKVRIQLYSPALPRQRVYRDYAALHVDGDQLVLLWSGGGRYKAPELMARHVEFMGRNVIDPLLGQPGTPRRAYERVPFDDLHGEAAW